jgi:hypothetical protein
MESKTPAEVAAQSPNTPLERLKELSRTYADEVLQNPVFLQEDAQKSTAWQELRADTRLTRARQAILAGLELATPQVARLWLCDCAEEALSVYEAAHPKDSRLREALEVARAFAQGKAKPRELQEAADKATDADRESYDRLYLYRQSHVESALGAVLDAEEERLEVANYAASAMGVVLSSDSFLAQKAPNAQPILQGIKLFAGAVATQAMLEKFKTKRLESGPALAYRDEQWSGIEER